MAPKEMDKIKARVRKLLDLARDGSATEGEVENAMRFAQKLMDDHHLSEDQCAVEDMEFDLDSIQIKSSRTMPWELTLAHAIQMTVGTVQWYRRAMRYPGGKREVRFEFYGPVDDVSLAKEMWSAMHFTIEFLAHKKYGAARRGSGRDYAIGFADCLFDMAKEHSEGERTQECRALVHVRSDAAQRWFDQTHPDSGIKTVKPRPVTLRDPFALDEGYADGRDHTLGRVKRKVADGAVKKMLA